MWYEALMRRPGTAGTALLCALFGFGLPLLAVKGCEGVLRDIENSQGDDSIHVVATSDSPDGREHAMVSYSIGMDGRGCYTLDLGHASVQFGDRLPHRFDITWSADSDVLAIW